MHEYIQRSASERVGRALKRSPAVAILGPRQSGKSTLARRLLRDRDAVYLDLQNRVDLSKLTEPELFLDQHRTQLVCLDEIQRLPEFFTLLRSEIDRDRRPGRFLILGSASRDLIRQSNESLAGRIAYQELTPLLWPEVAARTTIATHWTRGGFPDSLLSRTEADSFDWRHDFIQTFLERDIPSLGFAIPMPTMRRLWRLLAHYHGQTVNYSKLAEAVDLSVQTLKKYLAILEQTYMLRSLPPAETNLKKRLVKAPKLYIRDTGLLHALLEIETFDDLLGHGIAGASWEGFALEQIVASHPRWRPSFIRTSNGAEVDLLLERGTRQRIFEFKASKAPKPSRGFFELVRDLEPEFAAIVAPVDEAYQLRRELTVLPLLDACRQVPQ